MRPIYALLSRGLLVIFLLVLSAPEVRSQAPSWQAVFNGANPPNGGYSIARAVTVDAAGNVYVTGSFFGQVTFGNTSIVSVGNEDVFVAKWEVSTSTWAWARAGGGIGADIGYGIAVSGTEVFVTGSVTNSGTLTTTTQNVQFGGTPLFSASTMSGTNEDVFVAKWDASTSTWAWARSGGGIGADVGSGIAVSGTEVFVTGRVSNSGTANTSTDTQVQFGSLPLFSASTTTIGYSDVFVVRYSTAGVFGWARAAGGSDLDAGYGIAVSGTDVFITGTVTNSGILNTTTTQNVQFGGTPLFSASTTSAAFRDMFVACYSTAGAFGWARTAGGTSVDLGYAIAVRGTEVFVTGSVFNAGIRNSTTDYQVQFGGTPLFSISTVASLNADVFVARYSTAGTFGWVLAGGGTGLDAGYGLAASGNSLYVSGSVDATADFSGITLATPLASTLNFVGRVDFTPVALGSSTANGRVQVGLALFPNPARGMATLRLPAGTAPSLLTLTDALGRTVRRYPAPAGSEATLDLRGLPAGLYLLRGAGPAQHLVVE